MSSTSNWQQVDHVGTSSTSKWQQVDHVGTLYLTKFLSHCTIYTPDLTSVTYQSTKCQRKFKIQRKERAKLIQKVKQKIKDERKDGIKDDWPQSGVSQDLRYLEQIQATQVSYLDIIVSSVR